MRRSAHGEWVAYDDLAVPTPERAQESAGVRLTSEHIMEIADRYSTVEGDEIVEFARAVESAVLSANKEPQP
jgi:hypothetical protein